MSHAEMARKVWGSPGTYGNQAPAPPQNVGTNSGILNSTFVPVHATHSPAEASLLAAVMAAQGVPGGNTQLQGNSVGPPIQIAPGVFWLPVEGGTGGIYRMQGNSGVPPSGVTLAAGGCSDVLPAGGETGSIQMMQGNPGVSPSAVAAALASAAGFAHGAHDIMNPVYGQSVIHKVSPEISKGQGSRNLE